MSYSKQSKDHAEPAAQKKSNSGFLNDSRPMAAAALQRQAQMATSPVTAKQQAMTQLMANQQSPLQRAEDEELLQGKFDSVQRVEDEELLQGKFETAQLAEDEELVQGKFKPLQRAGVEEEEPLRGKFSASPTTQRVEQTGAKANNTGLPNQLKSGIENLSGMSLNHVKVHYNSPQPAQLNAHAYAQGSDIHVAPGQEQHLPHEAWHVVQQAQGRVKPTMQMKSGVPVNDDVGLESEADVMGAKALASGELTVQNKSIQRQTQMAKSPAQAKAVGQEKPVVQEKRIAPVQTNSSTLPIQKYTASEDGNYFVSENNQFAVAREAYPNSILTDGAAPMALPGGLKWINAGAEDVDDVAFTKYQADISDYEAENGPGSAKFCGQFARGLVGELPTEDQSTAEPGGVLYDRDTTPEGEDGWENHYASVVIKDGGDHATFETAVGIDHVWAGIYGSQKGQTFKYKTQQANIDRLMTIPDFVIPAEYRTRKGFWDYVLCRPGRRVKTKEKIVVPRGITMEQGEIWKNEMEAWRRDGTPPASAYIKAVVEKLEIELKQLS